MNESIDPHEGLRFTEDESFSLGRVSDLYKLLLGIDEAMPDDATLYLEGTSIAPEITTFLKSHASVSDTTRPIACGTLWPSAKAFHLSLDGNNMSQLRELAEHHAEPEICDHLGVYRGDNLLLWAPDAGDGDVELARSLPGEVLRKLEHSLGNSLEKEA